MINKKVFALTLVAASVIAAGCSSDDDDDPLDPVTDNGDVTDTGDTDDTDPMEPQFVFPDYTPEGNSVADVIATDPRLAGLSAIVPPALLNQLDYDEDKRTQALADADAAAAAGGSTDADTDTDIDGDVEGDDDATDMDPATDTPSPDGTDDDDMDDLDTDTDTDTDGVAVAPVPDVVDYTVFAPNDDALAAVDTTGLTGEELSNLLLGHVVLGTITAEEVGVNSAENDGVGGPAYTALNGSDIQLSTGATTGQPAINGTINLVDDGTTEASNGIVHIIDMVILPTTDATTDPDTDTDTDTDTTTPSGDAGPVETGLINSSANSQFTQQFLNSFQGSLDNDTERGAQPWTVFAPTNDALGGGTLDLQNYIVTTGAFDPEALAGAGTVTTNNGVAHQVSGTADGGDLSVDGNTVTVISESDNAIVYSVDGILN